MPIHCIPARLSLAAATFGVTLAVLVPIASLAAQMPTSIAQPPKPAAKAAKSDAKAAPKAEASLLPSSFSGWEAVSALKPVTDPVQADSANAAALKEYGFTDAMLSGYQRNGETLKV